MKQLILGKSPITSILGYVAAGIMIIQTSLDSGETNWLNIAVAVALGLLGRKAGDSSKR
ncbi:hypothetical protein [Chitinophaga sp. sic0106]|uniref:hypothetical protein n=1 Tax=Chitinophaga sp. sic0106 TaxID=2854785 RepID=UPI001C47DAE1|nr:hypothetical protein [Chitinophaga sp. sic0106]MBV7529049.1 hypothetical protein [Chitinophaga sp. sic0106]